MIFNDQSEKKDGTLCGTISNCHSASTKNSLYDEHQ